MDIFLGILGVIIFLVGCYLMGNFIMDTFDDDIVEQIVSSLYGMICWLVIAIIVSLCILIFTMIRILVNV